MLIEAVKKYIKFIILKYIMENLMNMFNPETMKNLMENDEIKNMLNDPNIMGNLKNMMGHSDLFKSMNGACEAGSGSGSGEAGSCEAGSGAGCCVEGSDSDSSSWIEGDINLENLENIDILETELNINDKVKTHNLKNETYNNKHGIIEAILPNGRYVVTFDDNKSVAIKEENLLNRFSNIEHID
jgi:hypothetical protein